MMEEIETRVNHPDDFENCKTNTSLFCLFIFYFSFYDRIFKHFVNLNTAQGQQLLSGANNVIKRQEEDDRMESGRIMTFCR